MCCTLIVSVSSGLKTKIFSRNVCSLDILQARTLTAHHEGRRLFLNKRMPVFNHHKIISLSAVTTSIFNTTLERHTETKRIKTSPAFHKFIIAKRQSLMVFLPRFPVTTFVNGNLLQNTLCVGQRIGPSDRTSMWMSSVTYLKRAAYV